MSLMSILEKQKALLDVIATNHNNSLDNISNMHGTVTKKDVCNYIKDHAFFMNQEVTELLLAIGNEDSAIIKPWSTRHNEVSNKIFIPTDSTKSEAVDMLCFCLNICLAAGISPDNIEQEYEDVWCKNIKRQTDGY